MPTILDHGIAARYDGSRYDVVSIEKTPSYGLSDAINVDRGSRDECNNKTNGGCKETRNHQCPKPADIKTVVC